MAAERPPRAAVRAAVRAALADLAPGDRVLVGLSGGPDSLALLAAAVAVAGEQGVLCGAVVVDHGLQPGSAEVAARAADQARILGCADVHVVRVVVDRGPGSGGLEAAARTARYAAIERCAATSPGSGATVVLLGHTRDDQAETVLLRLARGSGTRSLAGMASVAGIYRRPLLDLPRGVVAQAAADLAAEDPRLAPWRDPHNDDRTHARVRVRTEVLPVLEAALGPGVVEALARTARLAREDADALDAWAERAWTEAIGVAGAWGPSWGSRPPQPAPDPATAAPEGRASSPGRHQGDLVARLPLPIGLGASGSALPDAIASRVVRRLLIAAGSPAGALTADHVRAVRGLLDSPGSRAEVALPGGVLARREGDALVVRA